MMKPHREDVKGKLMTARSTHSFSVAAAQTKDFDEKGFVVIEGLLEPEEVQRYRSLYDRFLCGEIRCDEKRSDLGGHIPPKKKGTENVTQIMWPSALCPPLLDGSLHQRAIATSRCLFGGDMDFDFDMLINKAPHTDAPTPWHQDAAYWIDLPDRRAVSFWVARDESTLENGCMWFVPGSHIAPGPQSSSRTQPQRPLPGSSSSESSSSGVGMQLKLPSHTSESCVTQIQLRRPTLASPRSPGGTQKARAWPSPRQSEQDSVA